MRSEVFNRLRKESVKRYCHFIVNGRLNRIENNSIPYLQYREKILPSPSLFHEICTKIHPALLFIDDVIFDTQEVYLMRHIIFS